ncbi:MAG: hypothetical protein R2727_06460 [Bacteroidales bacterium]
MPIRQGGDQSNSTAATMFSYDDQKEMEGKLMPENLHSGEGLYFAENLGPGAGQTPVYEW